MKRYVRHAQTGDLAFVETIDGNDFVRYEGRVPNHPIPYRAGDWVDEATPRKMSLLQSAQVAYAADQQLLYFLGLHARSRKPWISLRDEDRIQFAHEGPKEPRIRRLLWKSIMMATEPLRKGME